MYRHKVAYISRVVLPDPAANALQTVQMAAAFARQTGNTHLFVHDLAESEDQLLQRYAIDGSPLKIWSLKTKRWPSLASRYAKAPIYNSAVAAILGLHGAWRPEAGWRRVLFVRSRLESLYWGLLRPYLKWLRDWIFLYEAHDLQLDTTGDREKRRARTRKALASFDSVICTTDLLADDISKLTSGVANCVVVPMSTGLQRLTDPPVVTLSHSPILLGYIGTIDQNHGINVIIEAFKMLPEGYSLRLVGPVRADNVSYLSRLLEDNEFASKFDLIPPVHYSDVASEIDICDIVLAPAGNTKHSRNYRSPLKLFDYMARGKPIVAASVASHKELLQDGKNAQLYRRGDPKDMAKCIMSLVNYPQQAQNIARIAWEQSVDHTYKARASRIIEIADDVWSQRYERA